MSLARPASRRWKFAGANSSEAVVQLLGRERLGKHLREQIGLDLSRRHAGSID